MSVIIHSTEFSMTGTLGPSLSMQFDENQNNKAEMVFAADFSGSLVSSRNDFICSAHLEWNHENDFVWELWEAALTYRPIDNLSFQIGKIIFPWGIGYSHSVGDVINHKIGEQTEGFWGALSSFYFTYDIALSYLLSVDDFAENPELADFFPNALQGLYLSAVIGPVQAQLSISHKDKRHLRPSAGFSIDVYDSIFFSEVAWEYENPASYYDQGWQDSETKGNWLFTGGCFKSISFYPIEFTLLLEYLYYSGGYSKNQWEDYLDQLIFDPITTALVVLPEPLMRHSIDLSLLFSYDKIMDTSIAIRFLPEDESFLLSGGINAYLSDDLDLSFIASWLSGSDKSIYGSQKQKKLGLALKYYF
ncbi:MAG: hypothetical protein JXR70_01800 [Spirochaetales bacterium]|nr:hypothetical protein [Spirochaetales bacterium]